MLSIKAFVSLTGFIVRLPSVLASLTPFKVLFASSAETKEARESEGRLLRTDGGGKGKDKRITVDSRNKKGSEGRKK